MLFVKIRVKSPRGTVRKQVSLSNKYDHLVGDNSVWSQTQRHREGLFSDSHRGSLPTSSRAGLGLGLDQSAQLVTWGRVTLGSGEGGRCQSLPFQSFLASGEGAQPETRAEKGQNFSLRHIRAVLTEATGGQHCQQLI